MIGRKKNWPQRLHAAGLVVVAGGVAAGMAIYLAAPDIPDAGVDLEESKVYLHNLEMYGGKANVLATGFMNWFRGLWEGKSLGITVACLAAAVGVLMLLVAQRLDDGER